MLNGFWLDGICSLDVGIRLQSGITFGQPTPRVTSTTISGRSGDLKRYVELNITPFMRRKKLCGESFRTDVTSRLFTRNLSIIFYKVFKNAFKSGSSFQSGMAGVFILVSIVSNALRRASGLAFA